MKNHVWTLILLLATVPAMAQEPSADCKPGEKFLDCANRLLDAAMGSAVSATVQQMAVTEKTAIARKSVPDSGPDTASSLHDVLPLFFSSLGLGNASSTQDDLTLNFNPELLSFGPNNPMSLKAVIHKPVLFEAMVNQLPDAIRADRKSSLTDQLKDFDDVEYSLGWSRQDDRFGRAIQPHLGLIADTFLAINQRAIDATRTDAKQRLLNVLASPHLPPEINTVPVYQLPADASNKVVAAL